MDTSTNMPMTAAVIASTQTQTNPQNIPPVPPSKPNRSLQFFLLLFVFILGTGVGSLLLLKAQQGSTNNGDQLTPTPTPTKAQAKLTETKRWLNLSDIRQVVEDGNKLYLAVMGGVAVVDKDSGKVLDQITMADGMRNYTTTSMVKKGNTLYVGTQDGFSVINLDTRGIKNISEQEGLVNGANILVKEDGDNIWVGTFRGVSVYNTKTGELKNYQSEFDNGSVPFNATDLVVTPTSVYTINAAGGNANTLVAGFDKATQKWTNYKLSDFGSASSLSLFNLTVGGGEVWVTDWKHFWHKPFDTATKWQEDTKLAELAIQNGLKDPVRIVGGSDLVITLSANNILWNYVISEHKLGNIYPERLNTEGENIFANSALIGNETSDLKWWVRPYEGFLSYYDLRNITKSIDLADRPVQIGQLLAVVDHDPILAANNGIWKYDPQTGFKKLLDITDKYGMTNYQFRPVDGSSQALLYTQVCGQGCEAPKLYVYDYQTDMSKSVDFDTKVLKAINKGNSELRIDSLAGHVASFSAQYPAPIIANIDLDSMTWTIHKDVLKKVSENLQPMPFTCNANYTFEIGGNKFDSDPCQSGGYWGTLVENGKTHFYLYTDGNKQEMYPQLAAAEYSPFGSNSGLYIVSQVSKINDELWVGTDRGLAIYNFTSNSWRLVSTKKGLTTNKIGSFVIDGDILWNIEMWSGLSGVVLK